MYTSLSTRALSRASAATPVTKTLTRSFTNTDITGRIKKVESSARTYANRFPISIAKAKGAVIWDSDGNQYLDALAGAGTLNIGHNHPVVVEAAKEFLDSGHPMQLLDLSSPVKDKFIAQLMQCIPEYYRNEPLRIQFCSPAGTDVTEAALKLARYSTGRSTVLSFSGGYHGHTAGALACMGNLGAKQLPNLPSGVQFLPFPYAYRCPFGIGVEGHKTIAEYVERMLGDVESGIVKPAAMILEVIQGEGGVVPAEKEFIQRMRKVTQEHDIVLIVDEIQTGFCRTGQMFAHEEAGIVPDILCLSKSIGGGQPLGVIVYQEKFDKWQPGAHAGTFRGNQLGMATGTAALRWSIENNLAQQAAKKGAWLRQQLEELRAKYPTMIGDIRGRGMMLGAEVVNDSLKPDTLGALPPATEFTARLQQACLNNGLMIERGGRHGGTMRFLCPLVIEEPQLEQLATQFKKSFDQTVESTKKN